MNIDNIDDLKYNESLSIQADFDHEIIQICINITNIIGDTLLQYPTTVSPCFPILSCHSPISNNLSIDRISIDRISIDETYIDRISIDETSIDRISIDETSIDETSIDETSIDETSIDETIKTFVHKNFLLFNPLLGQSVNRQDNEFYPTIIDTKKNSRNYDTNLTSLNTEFLKWIDSFQLPKGTILPYPRVLMNEIKYIQNPMQRLVYSLGLCKNIQVETPIEDHLPANIRNPDYCSCYFHYPENIQDLFDKKYHCICNMLVRNKIMDKITYQQYLEFSRDGIDIYFN